MARVALTEDQVSRILGAPKVIKEDLRWTSKDHPEWVGCELNVENQLKVTLHIYANANLVDRSKYSFTLVMSRNYPIARLDAGGSHQNRHTDDGRWFGEAHKHRWTDRCRDSFAYTPTDIDTGTLESAFGSFCREIGVEFQGQVEPLPPSQTALSF
jgi:hypothetical protein